jgi:AP-1 complex subunit mu
VLNREDFQVKPVFASNGFIYCWIQHRDIYGNKYQSLFNLRFMSYCLFILRVQVVGVAVQNCNATMILVFLYHVVDVLTRYLKVLQENSLMNNFVVTYELLDEMMDAGYPQTTGKF